MSAFRGDVARDTAARWPYAVGLGGCILAAQGLAFAPISGVMYFIALPGLVLSAYWAIAHRSPSRIALTLAAILVVCGLAAGAISVSVGDVAEGTVLVIILAIPLTVLALGIPGTAAALRHPGHAR